MYNFFRKKNAWGSSRFLTRSELTALIESTGIAFIHIPKAAGTSISTWLYGRQPGHRTWEFYRALDKARFENWRKIAIVRDPAERFLSALSYLSEGGTTRADRNFARKYVRQFRGADDFAARLLDDPKFRSHVLGYYHFQPQIRYVAAADGRIMVNHLIAFERIAEDLPRLAGNGRPIPQLNRTVRKTPAGDLTPAVAACIREFYRADSALYKFALREKGDVFGKILPGD